VSGSWAKVVCLVVIAAILFVVIAPDVDLQPTVSRVPHIARAVQKPGATVFQTVIPAGFQFFPFVFSRRPLRTSAHIKGDSFADLIDLKCSRLC
jgi:hypothetical protein